MNEFTVTHKTHAHFIDIENSRFLRMRRISHIPRVGDEIRLSSGKYYKVVAVIHVYDEDFERVNIGCKKAEI